MYSLNWTEHNDDQMKINTAIWTVPNFLSLLEKNCLELRTAKKNGDALQKFRLKMQLLGYCKDIIELYYISADPLFLRVRLDVCLEHFEERLIEMTEFYAVSPNKWQYLAHLFTRDIDDKNGYYLLKNGSLQLKFQFTRINELHITKPLVAEAHLGNDFENLLNTGLFADVILKSADEVDYRSHKHVLASRSAVLRALFDHNMTESRTNVIESPLESDILREVLTFIYSDKSPRIDEIPDRLLEAADYLQLTRLKSLCEEALQKKLTVDNVIDTLLLAELYSAPALKQMALEFIKDGHVERITRTEGWKNLKSADLIKTIYRKVM